MAQNFTIITLNPPAILTFPNTLNSVSPSIIPVAVVTQTSRDGAWQPIVIGPPGAPESQARSTIILPPGFGYATPTQTPGADLVKTATQTSGPASSISVTATTATIESTRTGSSSTASSKSTSSGPKGTSTSNSTTGANPNSGSRNETVAGSQHNDSNSITPGAAAGIGIGCAIAGALIAAAILALLFRRRRRRSPARSDVIPLNGFASVEKSVASPDPSSPAGVIERNLPQPAEDQALGGEMSRLQTSIKNHVQSYYHTNAIGGSVDQVALGLVAAGNMPLIASTLGSLLSNPATRLTAIRFCIAWVAISRVEHNCEPSRSFLPPEIASCLVSIAGAREDPSTRMAFLSRWRTITASLLQSKYGGNTFTPYDPRNQNIGDALQALDSILSPFAAEERTNRERLQKLEEILKRGARFGFLLFSQPSTWEFDWSTPPSAGRGALALSPSLVQIGDDNGRRLPRPRTVEEPELARGLESYL